MPWNLSLHTACLGLLLGLMVCPAGAQVQADTVFTWRGYGRTATCHLRIYPAPPGEERTHTLLIREVAENEGASTVADARHLAELIGRRFGIDPAAAYWVFHWGAFSHAGARPNKRKELFLRATFRRNKNQSLSPPQWKVITRAEVEDYTDRHFH